jgi:hypothetical protein
MGSETKDLNSKKIDNAPTDGLLGTVDSLAYRVHEIKRHLHSNERWYGVATVPNGEIHVADRIGVGINAFQIDAGNNNWGSWLQVLGSSDTPADTGNVYFDGHRIQIEAAEKTETYFVQFSAGATAAAGLAALTYTEFVYRPETVQGKPAPIVIQTRRTAVGIKLWARCLCPGQNTATLDFYFAIHEYEG